MRTREDAWLITGEFVRVNEGSRALRGLIGLGAGVGAPVAEPSRLRAQSFVVRVQCAIFGMLWTTSLAPGLK